MLNALKNLLFVIEGKIARYRAGEPAGGFFRFDQGHFAVSSVFF
jgi:hypothetical protein